jgi:predicted  nucleic acid-binding Zn-ribbon protein
MRDKKSMCECGHIFDDHTTSFEVGNNLCANVGCGCSQFRPTKDALDVATVAPAEVDSSLDIIPAGEVGSQPHQ